MHIASPHANRARLSPMDPILSRGLDSIHEHVLRPDARAFTEHSKSLLYSPSPLHGYDVEYDDLNVNDIGTPDDAVVIPIAEVRAA